jgi:phosphatidylglycerophosphate synthase
MLLAAVLGIGLHSPVEPGLRLALAGWLFVSSLLLDVLDGYLARKLNQVTLFGSLFDLTLDLLGHTFVWLISGLSLAPFLIALEWTAGLYMAAFSMRSSSHWKVTLVEAGPWLVRYYFKPQPINPLNIYSNVAHFILPISFFVTESWNWVGYLSLPGLILFEVVTLYMIFTFIKILVKQNG